MRMKRWVTLVVLAVLLTAVPAVLFAGGSGEKGKKVVVGAKNFTEQYLTGEMAALLLEKEGYKVDRRFGMTSFTLRQALLSGQVDLCNDYTGTGWSSYLKKEEVIRDDVELFEAVKEADLAQNSVVWMNRMKFNNTYALAVTEEFAEENGVENLEDLAALSKEREEPLKYAIEYEFYERPDGFFAMAEDYGLEVESGDVKSMDIGLTYDAIKGGDVDVSMVFSTDGNLIDYNLVVLEDPRNFFPIYNLCNVIRQDTLEAHPEIKEILAPMAELLDQETMVELNYRVDGKDEEPEDVAREFLTENGQL